MAAKKRTYANDPLGPDHRAADGRDGDHLPGAGREDGPSAGYLNHIVHGNRPVPSTAVLARIGKALGVKPDHFREVRVRLITDKLEKTPALVDRLYKRLS